MRLVANDSTNCEIFVSNGLNMHNVVVFNIKHQLQNLVSLISLLDLCITIREFCLWEMVIFSEKRCLISSNASNQNDSLE